MYKLRSSADSAVIFMPSLRKMSVCRGGGVSMRMSCFTSETAERISN
jgi:hypothetical protein